MEREIRRSKAAWQAGDSWVLLPARVVRAIPVALRIPIVLVMVALGLGSATSPASAAPALTVTPLTWNVIGLDSNDVNAGPNLFVVGARACNTGTDPATNVQASFVWDSFSFYLSVNGPTTLTQATLVPGACRDFYFHAQVVRSINAYDKVRRYHISVSADTVAPVSTPTPRELYVEHLVSQNRNGVDNITGPGGPGDPPATTVYVGQTYVYKLYAHTATGGYEQLESFVNFPNVIFQIVAINRTYTAPPGATGDQPYGDACGWDTVPTSPTYRQCIGPYNYPGGKVGGNMVSTYTVKILSAGTATVSSLIYDHSGSSYHYNNDYGVGVNSLTITSVDLDDVSITKTHTGNFTVGQQGSYDLAVTNTGTGDANGPITATDTLPAGLTYVSATGSGWSCSAAGQNVTCTHAGLIATGATSNITLTVNAGLAAQPSVTNTASVSVPGTDPTPGDNSSSDLTVVDSSADLSITKSHTGSFGVGQQESYQLNVSNAGPNGTGSVTVTDTLPNGLTFVSGSGAGWSCSAVGQDVTCTHAAVIASGGSSQVDVAVDVDVAAEPAVTNTASVSSTTFDPDASNNSSSDPTTVRPSADVSVTVTDAPDPLVVGNDVTYSLTVHNAGPSTANAVHVDNALPPGVTFVSATPSVGTCSNSGLDASCDLGDMAVGADVTIDIVATTQIADTITDTATVSTDSSDPDGSNDQDSATTQVDPDVTAQADLSLTKTHAGDFTAGSQGTYHFTVHNDGPDTAWGRVTITDTLPAGLTYVSASGPEWVCSASGQDVTCDRFGSVEVGVDSSVDLVVDVGQAAVPGVTNTATVTSTAADPNLSNQDASDPTVVNGSADLALTNGGSPDPASIGDDVTYHLVVTNNGPSDATNVQVSNTLPAGVTFVSATPDQGTCSEFLGTVSCDLGDVANGAQVAIDVVVTATASGTLDDDATVSSPTTDLDNSNNSASASVQVDPDSADLSLSKTHVGDFSSGTQGTYDLAVDNNGPDAASGPVTITDTLPAGLSFSSGTGAGWNCSATDQDVTCTHAAALANGASSQVSLVVDVDPAAEPGVTNTATVSSTTGDPDPSNDSASDPTVVAPSADLSITNVDSPDPVGMGSDITYTLTITNNGPSQAVGVHVDDQLPAGVTYVSATPSQGGCSEFLGLVSCNLADLASGATATVDLVVTADQQGTVNDTATVSSSSPDADSSNDSATATTDVSPEADLSLAKTHAGDFTVGVQGTYTLAVHNAGPADAQGPITVTDTLPAGLTFASGAGAGWTCSAVGQDVTCDSPGPLATGADSQVDVTVDVGPSAAPGLTNSASVTSTTGDPDPSNDSSSDPTVVDPSADLAITNVDSPDPAKVSHPLTYTLTVTNSGPSDATAVHVDDPLPAGVTFVSATPSQGICSEFLGLVGCDLGDVAAGATATIDVVVTPTAPGPLTDTATVSSATGDPDPSNDSDTASTTVDALAADLSLVKTHPGSFTVGQQGTYTLAVHNAGPDDAAGPLTITDTLPAGMGFVSGKGAGWTCSATGQDVTCTNPGPLVSGSDSQVDLTVDVGPAAAPGVTNTASVTSNTGDPDPSNDSSSDPTVVDPVADVSITNSGAPDPVTAGQPLTYTLTVHNAGPSDATSVQVGNPVPGGATFVSATTTQGTCAQALGLVACDLGTLAAGSDVTIQLVVTPGQAGLVTDTATVATQTPDPDLSNNTASTSTSVKAVVTSADLSITKTHDGDFEIGSQGTYVLSVHNAGPDAAQGPLTVTDTLPVGERFAGSAGQGWDCTAAGQDVTCTSAGPLAANAGAQLELTVDVGPAAAPGLTNTASVSSTTGDPNDDDNASSDAALVSASADLAITNVGTPDPVEVGANLTYSLDVTNNGRSGAVSVHVDDVLPPDVDFVSAAPTLGTCSESLDAVVCDLGDMGSQDVATIQVTVAPQKAGTITDVATVGSSTYDPVHANDSASAVNSVLATPLPSADISVTKTHRGAFFRSGQQGIYDITVENHGPQDAAGPITVSDPLPAGFSFVTSAGGGWHCTGEGRRVTCLHHAALASGQSSTLHLVVDVTDGAVPSVVNAASANSRTSDPSPGNNVASDRTEVHLAAATPNPTPPPDDPDRPNDGGNGATGPGSSDGGGSLAYTGFDFRLIGSFAGLFLLGALMLCAASAWTRRRRPRMLGSGETPVESVRAQRRQLLRASRLTRAGLVSATAAILLVAHLGWVVWGTGLQTARAQTQLRAQLATESPVIDAGGQVQMPSRFGLGTPLGILRIPRIHLDMVFVEGTGESELTKGPGHYVGTAYPWESTGRTAIAGHRTTYLHPFYALDKLRPGDRIQVQTKAGFFRYVVVKHRLVDPSDVSVLRQTKRPTLILTTCNPPYSASQRLVVFAVRI
ncbi:MAG: sortase [Actinomycetota bacterium]